jgi:hypothetical protein
MEKIYREEVLPVENLETKSGSKILQESNKQYEELKNNYPELYTFIIDQVNKQKLKLNSFFQINRDTFRIDEVDFPNFILATDEGHLAGTNFYHPDGTYGVSLNIQPFLEVMQYQDEGEGIRILKRQIRRTIIHEYMHFALDKTVNTRDSKSNLIRQQSGLMNHSNSVAKIRGQEVSFTELNEAITEFMTIFYLIYENDPNAFDKISDLTISSIKLENHFYPSGYQNIVNKIIETLQELDTDKRKEFIRKCIEGKATNSIKPILNFLKGDGYEVNPIELYRLNYKPKSITESDKMLDTTIVDEEELAETLY